MIRPQLGQIRLVPSATIVDMQVEQRTVSVSLFPGTVLSCGRFVKGLNTGQPYFWVTCHATGPGETSARVQRTKKGGPQRPPFPVQVGVRS